MSVCQEYQHTNVCCSPQQLDALHGNMQQAASILIRCPTCFENFKRFWCLFTCSPNQSLFVTPYCQWDGLNMDPNATISEVGLSLNMGYVQNFYDSCKDTKMAATGSSVMTAFGNAQSAEEFIGFLAATSGLPPFIGGSGMSIYPEFVNTSSLDVEGQIPSEETAGMDAEVAHCSLSCSCTDCPSNPSCPTPSLVPEEKILSVKLGRLEVPLTVFISGLFGAILGVAIVAGAIILHLTKPNYDPEREPILLHTPINSNSLSKDRSHAQSGVMGLLAKYFRIHGRFMARHSLIVIVASLLFTGFCAAWTYRLQLITRPESLWVPPGSLTSNDKAYSDRQFSPFYRIEQTIIRQTGNKTNTPILNVENLMALYQSYSYLRNMTVWYVPKQGSARNITLDDVCFKPMLGKG